MCLGVWVHACKRCQELLTAIQNHIFLDFQLLLFVVTTLMVLQLGVLFNYHVYNKYQLPWLHA